MVIGQYKDYGDFFDRKWKNGNKRYWKIEIET